MQNKNPKYTNNQDRDWIKNKDPCKNEKHRTAYIYCCILPNILGINSNSQNIQNNEREEIVLNSLYEAIVILIPKPGKDTYREIIIEQYPW